ncbi:hypothetical protein MLD38_030492 [Melastoma candidum]|uniref:Uncharacterized protein n=1 Tax=Melastoma candidum TaxID=119954 RepID=A0ACB9MLZ6_9MYRT|nr:hypothetical protein MLD38_030492 [Melastoma candidum]
MISVIVPVEDHALNSSSARCQKNVVNNKFKGVSRFIPDDIKNLKKIIITSPAIYKAEVRYHSSIKTPFVGTLGFDTRPVNHLPGRGGVREVDPDTGVSVFPSFHFIHFYTDLGKPHDAKDGNDCRAHSHDGDDDRFHPCGKDLSESLNHLAILYYSFR